MNQWLLEKTVWRLTWQLWRQGVPGYRRRAIRAELLGNLYAVAAEADARTAVDRLGDLDQLAASYAETNADQRDERSFAGGIISALMTLFVIVLLNGRLIMALSGLKDRADFDPYNYSLTLPGGIHLVGISGNVEQGILLHFQFGQIAYLIFPALAFLIGLRPWRLIGRSRSSQPQMSI